MMETELQVLLDSLRRRRQLADQLEAELQVLARHNFRHRLPLRAVRVEGMREVGLARFRSYRLVGGSAS